MGDNSNEISSNSMEQNQNNNAQKPKLQTSSFLKRKHAYGLIIVIMLVIGILYINSSKSSPQSRTSIFSTLGQPFNSSELAAINNNSLAYYETAGEKLLNGSLNNPVFISPPGSLLKKYKPVIINNKPSVIYIGSITCIMCTQNRWAMALALAKFGSFGSLYKGYGPLDAYGGVPTIYWTAFNSSTRNGPVFGDAYNSNYINFIAADYASPIDQGANIQPPQAFLPTPNSTYTTAISFMNNVSGFRGTPYTFWGTVLLSGADAVVFGNSVPGQGAQTVDLSGMTHSEVLQHLKNFDDQFAWSEYAAADVYIAYLCSSLNNTSVAVCSLPAIKHIEAEAGLSY